MSWKITKHKELKNLQELQVGELVAEMAEYSYATYADSFINHFKYLVKDIPRSNNFSAENMYKAVEVDLYTVEIWKMTVTGDRKYKMVTLEYIKEKK